MAAEKEVPKSLLSSSSSSLLPDPLLPISLPFPRKLPIYAQKLGLESATEDLRKVLDCVNKVYGGSRLSGARIDELAAAKLFIGLYRQGEWGRWTLDSLP